MTGVRRHGKPYSGRHRDRARDVLVAVAGLAALLVGSAMLVGVLPGSLAAEGAFVSATACHGTQAGDCVRTAWFTVESVDVRRGRQPGGRVRLSGAGGGDVRLGGLSTFLEHVQPGDRVAGTIWRGEIVVLSDGAAHAQRTDSHPVGQPLLHAGTGILAVMGGGVGLHVSRQRLRRGEGPGRPRGTPAPADIIAVALLAAGTFVLMALLHDRDESVGSFLRFWTPAAVAAAAFLSRHRLRRRTRR